MKKVKDEIAAKRELKEKDEENKKKNEISKGDEGERTKKMKELMKKRRRDLIETL